MTTDVQAAQTVKVRDVFGNRDFFLLWIGQLISNIGTYISMFTFPILAFAITGEEYWLGIIGLCSLIPTLLFSPIAGVVVDTHDRKRIMILSHLLSAILILIIPLALAFETNFSLESLMVIMCISIFLSSTVQRFFSPAESASIPKILNEDEKIISVGVSITQTTQQIIMVLGPIIGIFFFTIWGYYVVFLIDSLTFIFAILFILLLKSDLRPEIKDLENKDEKEKVDLLKGTKILFTIPSIRLIAILLITVMFGVSLSNNFFLPLAKDQLGLTDGEFGIGITLVGLTGVISGIILTTKISKVNRPILLVVIGVIVNGSNWMLFSFIDQQWQYFMLIMVGGVVNILLNVPAGTVFMRDIPDNVRGQVFSSVGQLMSLAGLLGLLVGTASVSTFGVRILFFINGFLQFLISIIGLIYLISKSIDGLIVKETENELSY